MTVTPASPKQPWSPPWKIVRPLSEGGQAATFLVRSNAAEDGVLKRLRCQDDPERRRRMHREVVALQTLEHPRIPRIFVSNSSEYATDAVLYFIAEFIPGPTLWESLKNRMMSVEEATTLVVSLLKILVHTHENGVIHRDIKPDNIILRHGQPNDPVLIDFGLSFNRNQDDNTLVTDGLQQLGNRFLGLPELQISSSLKRDPRSDLTQAAGILFYVITGVMPVALTDESLRLPHQRNDVRTVLNAIPERVRRHLLRVFDRSFVVGIDQRWQSAEEFLRAIEQIHSPPSQESDVEAIELSNVGQRLTQTTDYARCQRIESHVNQILKEYDSAFDSILKQLGKDFVRVQSGHATNWRTLTFGNSLGVSHQFIGGFSYRPSVEGEVTGNEIIVFFRLNNERTELIRFPINAQPELQQFRERLTQLYKQGIARVLESIQ